VLQVVSAACRQGGLQLLAPFLIGPGEPKHPVRGQAEVAQYRPEWLTRIDRVEEPLPHLDGEPLLRSGQSPGLLGLAVCPSAKGAVASGVPTCRRAVACCCHRANPTASFESEADVLSPRRHGRANHRGGAERVRHRAADRVRGKAFLLA
jgi:hypothetical protein